MIFISTEGSLVSYSSKLKKVQHLQKDPYVHPIWNSNKKQDVSRKIEVFRNRYFIKNKNLLK